MLSVAGDWVDDDDEGVAESAILRDVTPGRVGPAAAAPLVVGGGWLEGLVVIRIQYKYSPVLQVKIVSEIGDSEEGKRE